ncbi:BTAD domain-containing putative transcriptional regulator [Cryptosporangium sp. NPDC051539]|uniref:BTAD domain-containing putative transcriptional regulator n=1 Tax=Cryptosporangium sp. NPDC051539 TaxID=3363962 RepID=UPI0037B2165D
MLELRLLGPMEARWQGEPVDLGSRKARFVLAVLALEPNRQVSVDRLVGLLWPVRPPRTAEHAVQVAVSAARAALGRIPSGVTLTRQGAGYLLRCDPQCVDVHRFRTLLAEAHEQSDGRRQVDLLDVALSLWRGDPLGDCAPAEIRGTLLAGLDESRLAAIEDRLDARLRLGQHRAVLDELTALVTRHPLRERLVGQLMLALYRDGRAGHALAAYREARERWAEELGLDPGAELAGLQAAILRSDPSLALPAVAAPPAVPRVRVLLVDDHPAFRLGLRAVLETDPGFVVAGEAGDVGEALDLAATAAPDVVVMDLHLPDRSGAEATRLLLAAYPNLAVIVLTLSGSDADIVAALRAGAHGYLLKSAGRDEILNALRGALRGTAVFSAEVAARLRGLVTL